MLIIIVFNCWPMIVFHWLAVIWGTFSWIRRPSPSGSIFVQMNLTFISRLITDNNTRCLALFFSICKSVSLAPSRATWPSRARSPSWWRAPSWAPAAASCRFHQLQHLPPRASLCASSLGRGTQMGCSCPCHWTQSPRDWSWGSVAANCAWPFMAPDNRSRRWPLVGTCHTHTHTNTYLCRQTKELF